MKIQHSVPQQHWAFFETIDEDLHEYSRYLEFHKDNFKAYSVNLARLYLSICSEIDVLLKVVCTKLGQPARNSSINHYRAVISKHFPNFGYFRVVVRPMEHIAMPWLNWRRRSKGHPDWWGSYNKVKHQRNLYFSQANLKNVLLSAAGLYVVLFLWHYLETGGVPNIGGDRGRLRFPPFHVFGLDEDMQELIQKGAHVGSIAFKKVARWGRPPTPMPP